MSKHENFFDAWGQVFETAEYEVPLAPLKADVVDWWRNGRGEVVKVRRDGQVFEKTQYDGAGRVTNRAVSYDTAESTYADADDLLNDTVIEETRLVLDGVGESELVRKYDRRHTGTGTGGLTVGTSGNSRPQYIATWFDKLHRQTHVVSYGTNGGTDMTSRPSGNPPSPGREVHAHDQEPGLRVLGSPWDQDPAGVR
jgi:hypothetical protein